MGQAKTKKLTAKNFILDHPICCYCGSAAETIDHVPSIQTFRHRQRPSGLEVPACYKCNQATKLHEEVAAFFTRFYPEADTPLEKEEMRKVIQHVVKKVPALRTAFRKSIIDQKNFRRMLAANPALEKLQNASPIRMDSPVVDESLRVFTAKLGFALYYLNNKEILPSHARIVVRWATNYNLLEGHVPHIFLDALNGSATLKQGSKHVADQFLYKYIASDTNKDAVYVAALRQAFICMGSIQSKIEESAEQDNEEPYYLGSFHKLSYIGVESYPKQG